MPARISKFPLSLLIAGATIVAYFSTVQNDFVDYDDNTYVTENAYVKEGITTEGILYAFESLDTANYTPLTLFAYEVQVDFFGVDPWMMHATNLAIHLANSLLLFRFLRPLTNALHRSALVSLLFAIHPLHVESVAWISELKDLLSTLFLLLTLMTYLRYCRAPAWTTFCLTLVLFALGLLSKSMLVTLPILLGMMDLWVLNRWGIPDLNALTRSRPAQRVQRPTVSSEVPAKCPQRSLTSLVLEKVPFIVLSLLIGVITIFAQSANEATLWNEAAPFPYRMANAISAYGTYLVQTVFPVDLCALYLHPLKAIRVATIVRGAILLAVISLWVWRVHRSRPIVAFGWCWFFVTLLPVIGLLQVGLQAHADRYTYIPHIGLFIMIVWEAHSWLSRIPGTEIWGGILASAAVVPLVLLSSLQVGTWKDTESLWRKAIAVDPTNYVAHRLLGNFLLKKGRGDESLQELETALKINPDDPYIHNDVGYFFIAFDEKSKAETHFLRAIELDPLYERPVQNLSSLYRKQNRREEAVVCLKRYVENNPRSFAAQMKLADICWESGLLEQSEQAFLAALRLRPYDTRLRQQLEEPLQKLREQIKERRSSPRSRD